MRPVRRRLAAALVIPCCALAVAAGGGDEEPPAQAPSAAARAELAPVKGFLLAHTERLVRDVAAIRAGAEDYYALARGAAFDYAAMLRADRPRVRELVRGAQRSFGRATRRTSRWRASSPASRRSPTTT